VLSIARAMPGRILVPGRARTVGGAPLAGPSLGAHSADFQIQDSGVSPASVTLSTQASGSTMLGFLMCAFSEIGPVADNKGNGAYTLVDSSGYAGGLWPDYGLEVYAKTGAVGGSSHTLSATKSVHSTYESTLIGVEIKGAGTIQDHSIVARAAAGAGVATTSGNVTATGPARLVACWTGDGGTSLPSQAVTLPSGWSFVESLFLAGTSYIQACVAVADAVVPAGTYSMSFTPVSNQGGVVSLLALQA